jgi:GNAT superfamily N-acetyltransferase
MTARDRRFVVPTWARCSRYEGTSKKRRYELVDRIIDNGAVVKVLATDDLTVHGWAAAHGELLHFVYIAAPLRRQGLGRRIISAVLGGIYPEHIEVTHAWPSASGRFVFRPLREAA